VALKVFYSPRQTASQNLSRSPSAQKPALVVRAWQATGIPLEIVQPRPATLADLCRAHDPGYVRAVLAGQIPNGFGNTDPAISATLQWTSGSMLSAAEWAVLQGEPALSPTSGFHHAGWDYAAAYCTFNGLMVAALALHARKLVRRVAILDLDQHFGDGTRDILSRLGISWVRHYTYGLAPTTQENAASWLDVLPWLVREKVQGCDLVLYQAGADPHVEDPLGGGLTAEQLARRDRIVFEWCRETGVPVVVNLAGGYQKPVDRVVELHVNMLRALSAVYSPRETQGA
jgi:acetoin utilization deacetylase AcuC-like enzyme